MPRPDLLVSPRNYEFIKLMLEEWPTSGQKWTPNFHDLVIQVDPDLADDVIRLCGPGTITDVLLQTWLDGLDG